jgi:hypothetical protein
LHLKQSLPQSSILAKLAHLDYVGAFLFLVSSTAFLLPITLAGTVASWSSVPILLPFVLGFCGLVTLIFHQKHHSTHPSKHSL